LALSFRLKPLGIRLNIRIIIRLPRMRQPSVVCIVRLARFMLVSWWSWLPQFYPSLG
jgi:hypothetical protein